MQATEPEYMALSTAMREVIHLMQLMDELNSYKINSVNEQHQK
mgnify:CR=1 FL=1